MKKTIRILALVCALALCVGVLAACGGSPSSTPASTGGSTPASTGGTDAGSTASGDVPTLTWWTVGGVVPEDFEESMAIISDYVEEKVGVRLDYNVAGWNDYDTKMNTIVNAGESFDIMFTNNTNYARFVTAGAFLDLTDMLPTVTPTLNEFVPDLLWDGTRIGGQIYAVPTYKDSSLAQFWYFDDTYVQKYNIDVEAIKTFEDLDPVFRRMKEGEGASFYPVRMSQGSLWNGFFNNYDGLAAGIQPIGVRYDDKERKVVSVLEQEDVQAQLAMLNQWFKDGIINPDANVSQEDYKQMPFGNAQGWPQAVTTWQTLQGVDKYVATCVFGPIYTTETIQGSMLAISKNSKYPEEALKVIELANTDHTFRDMLAYGVEGKDFEYVSENVVKILQDTWSQGMAKYTQGSFFSMSTTDDGDPNQWNDVKAQNEKAFASECMGFALDITNIQNEVTNVKSTWEKYNKDLLTGALPVDQIPAIVEELKAAGLDTIIEEAQKQIDEFFAA